MTEELFDVAEFWLPSDSAYDNLLLEADQMWQALATAQPAGATKSLLADELVDGFVSSPATDRCADGDEDSLTGLAQRLTRSFLFGDSDDKGAWGSAVHDASAKNQGTAGSPMSTICGWMTSEKSDANCSPPLSRDEQRRLREPWGVLSEAAGQVMRLKLRDLERRSYLFERGLLVPLRKSSPAAPPNKNASNGTGQSTTAHVPTLQQLRAAQFYRLKQLLLLKQQQQQQQEQELWGKQRHKSNALGSYEEIRGDRPFGLSPSSWRPLHRQRQPAMIGCGHGTSAIFLNSGKKQCAGTGVFIPRTGGGKVNEPPRKKIVSSTVQVPTRDQAFNLKLEEFGAQPRFSGGISVDQGSIVGWSNAPLQNKLNQLHVQSTTTMSARDHRLPQEWSY